MKPWISIDALQNLRVEKPDKEVEAAVKANWDKVIKPIDSLGEFESLLMRIGGMTKSSDIHLAKKVVIVMCADNGIVEEGVSQATQEVTAIIAASMARNESCVCKMATSIHADTKIVDIGIHQSMDAHNLIHRKIAFGTKNFLKEPAMTQDEALQAIGVGIEMVKQCKEEGYQLLALGEMGIGNTTTTSAVTAALLGCSAVQVTGAGTGLKDEKIRRKQEVIQTALAKYQFDQTETLRILSCVGGLDMAGLAGVCIGGALYQIPIVLDGVISAAAALIAQRLVNGVKDYLIPSHLSREPAASLILKELGLTPIIYGNMALGEGTGAVMMFALLDMAIAVYENQIQMEDLGIEKHLDLEKQSA